MAITKNGSTANWAFTTDAQSFTTGNFTVAGSLANSILVVQVVIQDAETPLATPEVISVKWGGSGGTPLTRAIYHSGSGCGEQSIWYLVGPAAQTATIYVATAGTANVGAGIVATVWTGVHQTTPVRATATGNQGWGLTLTCDVSSAINDLVIDCAKTSDSPTSIVGNQTQDVQFVIASGYNHQMMVQHAAGAASVTMSWSWTNDGWGGMCAASFEPAATGTPINIALAVGGS